MVSRIQVSGERWSAPRCSSWVMAPVSTTKPVWSFGNFVDSPGFVGHLLGNLRTSH